MSRSILKRQQTARRKSVAFDNKQQLKYLNMIRASQIHDEVLIEEGNQFCF